MSHEFVIKVDGIDVRMLYTEPNSCPRVVEPRPELKGRGIEIGRKAREYVDNLLAPKPLASHLFPKNIATDSDIAAVQH